MGKLSKLIEELKSKETEPHTGIEDVNKTLREMIELHKQRAMIKPKGNWLNRLPEYVFLDRLLKRPKKHWIHYWIPVLFLRMLRMKRQST